MQSSCLMRLTKVAAIAAILASLLSAIWIGFRESQISLPQTRAGPLALGLGLYAMYYILNANAWLLILQSLGYKVSAAQGIPLWIRSESFRWLPGSVWNFGVRSIESVRHGVPRGTGAASMTLELAFSICSRLIFVAFAGMLVADHVRTTLGNTAGALGAGCVSALILTVVAIGAATRSTAIRAQWTALQSIMPRVVNRKFWLNNGALLLYYLGLGVLHGVALQCLVTALIENHHVSTMALVGANAAAWLVGFFAVFAPGGLVVREAALATALSAWFSPAESISIAVSWRVLQMSVEFLLLMCVVCWPSRAFTRLRNDVPRRPDSRQECQLMAKS